MNTTFFDKQSDASVELTLSQEWDKTGVIPYDKLETFFKENLK